MSSQLRSTSDVQCSQALQTILFVTPGMPREILVALLISLFFGGCILIYHGGLGRERCSQPATTSLEALIIER